MVFEREENGVLLGKRMHYVKYHSKDFNIRLDIYFFHKFLLQGKSYRNRCVMRRLGIWKWNERPLKFLCNYKKNAPDEVQIKRDYIFCQRKCRNCL